MTASAANMKSLDRGLMDGYLWFSAEEQRLLPAAGFVSVSYTFKPTAKMHTLHQLTLWQS